jgi:two-component SAPR family response regulator
MFFLSIFLNGQNLVAVSFLNLLKSLNIQFPILFLSCFPFATSQKFCMRCLDYVKNTHE